MNKDMEHVMEKKVFVCVVVHGVWGTGPDGLPREHSCGY